MDEHNLLNSGKKQKQNHPGSHSWNPQSLSIILESAGSK
jgi:hypothetical protein